MKNIVTRRILGCALAAALALTAGACAKAERSPHRQRQKKQPRGALGMRRKTARNFPIPGPSMIRWRRRRRQRAFPWTCPPHRRDMHRRRTG